MVSPDRIVTTDRVQMYDEMPAPVRPLHALANWTYVRLGNEANTQMGKRRRNRGTITIMMIANSNTIDITSEDSESNDDDLVY